LRQQKDKGHWPKVISRINTLNCSSVSGFRLSTRLKARQIAFKTGCFILHESQHDIMRLRSLEQPFGGE
jgi:hypothetical protein